MSYCITVECGCAEHTIGYIVRELEKALASIRIAWQHEVKFKWIKLLVSSRLVPHDNLGEPLPHLLVS